MVLDVDCGELKRIMAMVENVGSFIYKLNMIPVAKYVITNIICL